MLKGHVAIVTGGLQGMGLAIARELTEQGAHVAVGSRRGDEAEASVEARLAVGAQGMVAALDVASTDSVEAFVGQVRDSIGVPDILINAAGVSVHQVFAGIRMKTGKW